MGGPPAQMRMATPSSPLSAAPAETDSPSFALALVAVLAGGAVSSWLSAVFVAYTSFLTATAWTVVTSMVGAVGVKLVLRVLGYEIGIVAAVAALVAGSIVRLVLVTALPASSGPAVPLLPNFGMLFGLPSLLLSAWIVQNTAHSSTREASFS